MPSAYRRIQKIIIMKTIGICSDHAGYALKQYVKQWLETKGWEYKDFGTYSPESVDYPDFAHPLALAVEAGECYPGIAICGSGNGINMTLNKHQGVRAALCWTAEIAHLARQHNDANVLFDVIAGRRHLLTKDFNVAFIIRQQRQQAMDRC